jgi:hypothetical protein
MGKIQETKHVIIFGPFLTISGRPLLSYAAEESASWEHRPKENPYTQRISH